MSSLASFRKVLTCSLVKTFDLFYSYPTEFSSKKQYLTFETDSSFTFSFIERVAFSIEYFAQGDEAFKTFDFSWRINNFRVYNLQTNLIFFRILCSWFYRKQFKYNISCFGCNIFGNIAHFLQNCTDTIFSSYLYSTPSWLVLNHDSSPKTLFCVLDTYQITIILNNLVSYCCNVRFRPLIQCQNSCERFK